MQDECVPDLLLVEDDVGSRLSLELAFEDAGHRVWGVAPGRAGLQRWSAQPADAGLVDLTLPEMDG